MKRYRLKPMVGAPEVGWLEPVLVYEGQFSPAPTSPPMIRLWGPDDRWVDVPFTMLEVVEGEGPA